MSKPQIWIDVEDLFQYALHNPRPSGIQRLCYELYSALVKEQQSSIKFCRHDSEARILREVSWLDIETLFLKLTEIKPATEKRILSESAPLSNNTKIGILRKLVRKLPVTMREPIAQAYAAQIHVFSTQASVFRYARNFFKVLLQSKNSIDTKVIEIEKINGPDIRDLIGPGDTICVLGSPWFHEDYASFLEEATTPSNSEINAPKIALLIYDLIPILRPEWCNTILVNHFTKWFVTCVPKAEYLFAISKATAEDLEAWMKKEQIPLHHPIQVLPIGSGFKAEVDELPAEIPENLKGSEFVLFVSTIEARKNHLFVFRAWRRLIEKFGPDKVPTLVFAGRQGWLVADLMQQLINCSYLDGKIMFIPDPSDAELRELYRYCRFTIFPSLYEGWGLPVTESLAFGKVCVASDRASIPEAGGDFCLYMDPENLTEATDVIARACFDDALIKEKEALIRSNFKPTLWTEAANKLTASLSCAKF